MRCYCNAAGLRWLCQSRVKPSQKSNELVHDGLTESCWWKSVMSSRCQCQSTGGMCRALGICACEWPSSGIDRRSVEFCCIDQLPEAARRQFIHRLACKKSSRNCENFFFFFFFWRCYLWGFGVRSDVDLSVKTELNAETSLNWTLDTILTFLLDCRWVDKRASWIHFSPEMLYVRDVATNTNVFRAVC